MEIYNLQSRKWRAGQSIIHSLFADNRRHCFIAGNPHPQYIGYGTVVPLEESFLIVGGFHGLEYLDTIWRYEKDSDTWTRLEVILPGVVIAPIAMMVDIDIFPSC